MKRTSGLVSRLDSRTALSLGILALSAHVAIGCSSDNKSGLADGGTGGTSSGGTSAGTGGHTTTGTGGGLASGGTKGTGGGRDVDAGVDSGEPVTDASVDSGGGGTGGVTNGSGGTTAQPEAGTGGVTNGTGGTTALPDAGPPLDPGTGNVIVVGTNFSTSSGVAGIARPDLNLLSRVSGFDQDSALVQSGGRVFLLEHTNDVVDLLDAQGAVTGSIRLDPTVPDGGAAPTWLNPHDVVVVGHKAYVPLYNVNKIDILDLDTKTLTGSIDLSSFVEAGDTDGFIEPSHGFYDAVSGKVYFLADRIDIQDYGACLSVPPLLFAVDPTTDTVVPGNVSDAGGVHPLIALDLVGPAAVSFDSATRKILVAEAGCASATDAGTHQLKHGVEAVDLATGSSSVLYTATTEDYISGMIVLSPTSVLLDTFAPDYTESFYRVNLENGELGVAVPGVPYGSVADGPDAIVGVQFDYNHPPAPPKVIRMRLSDGKTTVLYSDPWQGQPYSGLNGVAIVR